VLEYAMAFAREAKAQVVTPEHLLLGLLAEEKGIAARVLDGLGLTLSQLSSLAPAPDGRGLIRRPEQSGRSAAPSRFARGSVWRLVMSRAGEEAHKLRHDYIGTEHILLALLRTDEGLCSRVLTRAKIRPAALRDQLELMIGPGHAGPGVISSGASLPLTSRSKKAMDFAKAVGGEFGTGVVNTEHMLLGLLAEENGYAAAALTQLDLTLDKARTIVTQLMEESDRAARKRARFQIRVDDASDQSIYEQIIKQVQEAVATGVLQPNDQLPTVRQLADELDIAPGTVARAYSELERRSVVVTKGIRGTRIAVREPVPVKADHLETLSGLLRPVAVAAFHFGASSQDLRAALEQSMKGIFPE